MAALLIYLIKSTICISVFYLIFRWTLKREKLFAFNRFLLLTILVTSVAIPLVKLPVLFHQTIDVKVFPEKNLFALPKMDDVAMQITTIPVTEYTPVSTERSLSVEQLTSIIYAVGVLSLFIILLVAVAKIGILLTNTKVYKKKNYRLALVNGTVSPMSFGRFIIMSKQDYKYHRNEILKHELAHIKFKHTYDLLLVELVKLFHWFNPLVYQLRNDLKEIQEFQVDQHLLRSGINSKDYQLLLIKKCVGAERYALANSFNHCQIKNRIVMMNNSKNKKGKSWKVAIFLPVAALMLMAFGNKKSEIPIDESQEEQTTVYNSENKNSNYKLPTESEWEIAEERLKTEATRREKNGGGSDFDKIARNELKDQLEKDSLNTQGVQKQMRKEASTKAQQIFIEIKTTGIYLNNELATLEKMKNKISKWIADKPDVVINVRVSIGVSDKQVNDVKSALREANAMDINYSTDLNEKDYPNYRITQRKQ